MSQQREKEHSRSETALDTARDKTRRYTRTLWNIIGRYSKTDRFTPALSHKEEVPGSFRFKYRGFINGLKTVPYLLLGAFLFSFYWDFPGYSAEFLGRPLQFEGLLRIVSVSGLIGFLTNYLAITMLFKPSRKRPILGYGLIPAQKDRIAYRLAQAVSDDLINPEIIKKKIQENRVISRYREQATGYIKGIIDDPRFREEIKSWVVSYVDEMIADPEIRTAVAEKILLQIEESLEDQSVERVALKAYSFIKGREMQEIIEEALQRLPSSIESGLDRVDDLLDTLPAKLDEHSDVIENIVTSLLYKLINQLDVRTLVEENLRQYDEQRLSNIIRGATNDQLNYIRYLGAVLGTIGGLVIWEPILSLSFLALLFGSVLLADQLLLVMRKKSNVRSEK